MSQRRVTSAEKGPQRHKCHRLGQVPDFIVTKFISVFPHKFSDFCRWDLESRATGAEGREPRLFWFSGSVHENKKFRRSIILLILIL